MEQKRLAGVDPIPGWHGALDALRTVIPSLAKWPCGAAINTWWRIALHGAAIVGIVHLPIPSIALYPSILGKLVAELQAD